MKAQRTQSPLSQVAAAAPATAPAAMKPASGRTCSHGRAPARCWRSVAMEAPKIITQVEVATAMCMAAWPTAESAPWMEVSSA